MTTEESRRSPTGGDAGHRRGKIGVQTRSIVLMMSKGMMMMVVGRGMSTPVVAQQTASHATQFRAVFVLVQGRQTGLDHRLETIDEQFHVVRVLSRDGERTGEAPQSSETARLKVTELLLLLTGVVARRTGDHLIDDGLHGGQDRLVVRERKNRVDLRVQEIVNHWKDFGKDDARFSEILVDDAHFILIRSVPNQRGQDRQEQRLSRSVRQDIRIQQQIRLNSTKCFFSSHVTKHEKKIDMILRKSRREVRSNRLYTES